MISPPFVSEAETGPPEVVIALVDEPALVAVGAVAGVEHFFPQRFSPNDVIGRVDKPIVVVVALLGSGEPLAADLECFDGVQSRERPARHH